LGEGAKINLSAAIAALTRTAALLYPSGLGAFLSVQKLSGGREGPVSTRTSRSRHHPACDFRFHPAEASQLHYPHELADMKADGGIFHKKGESSVKARPVRAHAEPRFASAS